MQATLWEAAKVVAQAAAIPAPSTDPGLTLVPVQLAALKALPTPPAAVKPAPVVVLPPQDQTTNYNIPAFIAAARNGRDAAKWVIFGSTAAFLGVIWAAIWFTVGK
jgi:hypothetical protein